MVRSALSGLTGVLAVLLLPVALAVTWVTDVGTDTRTFVNELRPVVQTEEVRSALTERVVDAVQAQLNLPDRVARQIRPPLTELVAAVVARPEVERAWASGLTSAHHAFVVVMDGEQPPRVDAAGRVIMPLTIPLNGVDRVLGRFGITSNAVVSPEIPISLFSVQDLSTARRVYAIGSAAGPLAPWIVAALAMVSLLLARRRVVTLALLGVGGIVATVLFAFLLVTGRPAAGGLVADPIGSAVVSAAYRIAEDGLMAEARLALIVCGALVVAAGLLRVILGRRG